MGAVEGRVLGPASCLMLVSWRRSVLTFAMVFSIWVLCVKLLSKVTPGLNGSQNTMPGCSTEQLAYSDKKDTFEMEPTKQYHFNYITMRWCCTSPGTRLGSNRHRPHHIWASMVWGRLDSMKISMTSVPVTRPSMSVSVLRKRSS